MKISSQIIVPLHETEHRGLPTAFLTLYSFPYSILGNFSVFFSLHPAGEGKRERGQGGRVQVVFLSYKGETGAEVKRNEVSEDLSASEGSSLWGRQGEEKRGKAAMWKWERIGWLNVIPFGSPSTSMGLSKLNTHSPEKVNETQKRESRRIGGGSEVNEFMSRMGKYFSLLFSLFF